MNKSFFIFSFITSVFSLATAFISQYAFGLMPCELCILQRIPYGVVIVLSFAGFLNRYTKFLPYLIVVCFLSGAAIATYHSLVEKHLVKGPGSCTSSVGTGNKSLEEMLNSIQSAPVIACDQPQWQFHGITMAMLNAVWSFFLACVMVFAIRRGKNAKAAG